MQQELFRQVLTALTTSQELVEKSSFDSINQHDKAANLVLILMDNLNNMTINLEAMEEFIEDMMTQQKGLDELDKRQQVLSKMLEEQRLMQNEASQCLQTIMEEQSVESEVIHDLEMQVASQREIIEEACYILK